MLKKNILSLIIFVFLISYISADIVIKPSEVIINNPITITIDFEDYGGYLYFHEYGSDVPIHSIDLGCEGNICHGKKSFVYFIDSSIFDVGLYELFVYSLDDNEWFGYIFEIIYTDTDSDGYYAENCTDSDVTNEYLDGKNYNVKGTITFGSTSSTDYCTNGSLIEYYCEGNEFKSETYNCAYGCEEGACLDTTEPPFVPPEENKKDLSKYSDKEVFLISSRDWRDVLSLIPITTWTENIILKDNRKEEGERDKLLKDNRKEEGERDKQKDSRRLRDDLDEGEGGENPEIIYDIIKYPTLIFHDESQVVYYKPIYTGYGTKNPSVSEDKAVWEMEMGASSDVYVYFNVEDYAGVYEVIPVTYAPGYREAPSISEDRIVWQDNRSGNWDIYMYDISTGQERQITTHRNDQTHPSISGAKIVWEDYRDENWDIYMYDISTGQETQITTDKNRSRNPAISNNKIVWEDDRNLAQGIFIDHMNEDVNYGRERDEDADRIGDIKIKKLNWDIYMYDISTGQETQITRGLSCQDNPSISGDKIVWEDYRDENWDIYMYDISTGQETQITTRRNDQTHPSISGDKIVWEEYKHGTYKMSNEYVRYITPEEDYDIHLYDLLTNKEKVITRSEYSYQRYPSISGDNIVWIDYRYSPSGSIYMYDDEAESLVNQDKFDVDSIIYFLQQYSSDRVTVIGDTSQELNNLLIAEPELGAGLNLDKIQRISVNDYLSYWESYKDIVYVEDNYELALLASTYASLINAPLIIKGTSLDSDNVFTDRNVICIGNVDRTCDENYNLKQLQKKYIRETGTDKVILVNPNDLNIKIIQGYWSERSPDVIHEIYSGTSLASPILASAKHEIILSTTSGTYQDIDNFLKSKINSLGINKKYLTIMAAPDAIPYRERMPSLILNTFENFRALDQTQYADFNSDEKPDIAAGRIQGATISDVSSYVARSLFYDTFLKNYNMKFMASPVSSLLGITKSRGGIENAEEWSSKFSDAGYNAVAVTSEEEGHLFEDSEWDNQHLISYSDHGDDGWAGISSYNIPYLDNSIIFNDACSTCSTYDMSSFCNSAIRKGALAHMGAVCLAWDQNGQYRKTMNGIYYSNLSIGKAFQQAYDHNSMLLGYKHYWMTTLFGDPTLNLNPLFMLDEKLN